MQLDANVWELMKQGIKVMYSISISVSKSVRICRMQDVPDINTFLLKYLPAGASVGVDPFVHSLSSIKKMVDALNARNITLKFLSYNLIDKIWVNARPSLSQSPIRIHNLEYSGKSLSDKLTEIRKKMLENKSSHLLLTSLDNVAWTFNLRGADISFSPVFYAYALITTGETRLRNLSQLNYVLIFIHLRPCNLASPM